jgi:hypothetical protein
LTDPWDGIISKGRKYRVLTEGVLMRRIVTLLSAVSLPVLLVLIPAEAARAAVTVNAPSCSSFYNPSNSLPKLECVESSSPAGVTVTWTWYSVEAKYTLEGTSTLTAGCLGGLGYTASFGYTSGGVTYSSKAAEFSCVPDKD